MTHDQSSNNSLAPDLKEDTWPDTVLQLPGDRSSPWQPSPFQIWRHFQWGLLWTAFKWSYLIQIVATLVFYFRSPALSEPLPQLLLPYYPMLVSTVLALAGLFFPAWFGRTRLGSRVAEADEKAGFQLGRKPGLILGCLFGLFFGLALPKFLALAASADGFFSLLIGLIFWLFLLYIVVVALELRLTPKRVEPEPEADPPEKNETFPGGEFSDYEAFLAMRPLTAENPYQGDDPDLVIRGQAARPESWRELWPDEPRIIEARDRLTRIIRLAGRLKSEALRPDDEMMAFLALTNWDEFHDYINLVMMIEMAFSVKITDEYVNQMGGLTYLEFIRSLLDQIPPDYELRLEDSLLEPLTLPPSYYQRGPWAWTKRHFWRRIEQERLREQQVIRPSGWIKKWSDYEDLAELREGVSRLLASYLDWPHPAFLPDDQLGALFHHEQGLEVTKAALKALNKEFGVNLKPDFVVSGERCFLDLLQYIAEAKKPPIP